MAFPTVQNARPFYPPAVPTGQLPNPGGATPVENAYRTQQQVANLYTQWRQAHSPNITPEVAKANAGAFSVSDAALQLPDVLKAVHQNAKDAGAKVNDILRGARVSDDNVEQVKAQRFWARAQRSLDAIKDPAKLVAAAQDLIANADAADIPTIAEELSEYMASRGVAAGWIPAALAQKIPGLADAQTEAILAHRQHAVLLQNDRHLRNAMAKDVAAPPLQDPSLVNSEPYLDSSTQ
jgi:hypothetical protein